jgi:uncharacterized membrane protein YbjE (DUF340 family)
MKIIIFIFLGIVAGILMRKWNLSWVNKTITPIIWLLLFELGLEVGSNDNIISALPTLGFVAAVIAITATVGSCLASSVLAKRIGLKRKTDKKNANTNIADSKKTHPLKGSLIILCFFITGIIIGLTGIIKNTNFIGKASTYTLLLLILCVGISIGHNKDVFTQLKHQNKKILLLPAFTIVGTLATCSLISLFFKYSLTEFLAVGSGQAYYSLSSILITEHKGIELGTIALLSNIIRELFTLLCAPVLYRIFGPLAPIAAGGATTADTTLPLIKQICGDELSIVSVYHGFLVDLSVPFLVELFCML